MPVTPEQFFGGQSQVPVPAPTSPTQPQAQQPMTGVSPQDFFNGTSAQPAEQAPSLGGFLGNVASSAGNFAGGIGNAIMHPIQTVSNLGSAAVGGAEEGLNTIGGSSFNNDQTKAWDNVVNFYKQRYGSVDNFLNTAYKDPVGFLADASVLASGVGGALGKIGDIADLSKGAELMNSGANLADVSAAQGTSGFSQAAKVARTVGEYTNPVALAGKGIMGLGGLAKEGLARSAGVLTSGGTEGARMAMEGNPDFMNAMRGGVTGEDVVNAAKGGLQGIKNARSADYQAALSNMAGPSMDFKGEELPPPVPATPEMSAKIQGLISQAPESKAWLDGEVSSLVKDVPGAEFHEAPIKSLQRGLEKVATEKGGDVSALKDVVRNTITVPDQGAADELIKQIGEKYDVVGEPRYNISENKYGGYRSNIINVKTPNGLTGEIQVTTPELYAAKQFGGSELYQRFRSMPDGVEKDALAEQMTSLYNKAFIEDKTVGGITGEAPSFAHELQGVVDDINKGGITYDYVRGKNLGGEQAYSVSMFPERSKILDTPVTLPDIADYIDKNADLLARPGLSLGGWYDTATGKIYLNITATPRDLETAKALGERYNQKAIFDLKNFQEIPTGGTGENIGDFGSVDERANTVAEGSKIPLVGKTVDVSPVKQLVPDLLKKFRIERGDDGTLDFGNSTISEKGHGDIKEAVKVLENWDDATPLGVDALKRRLGDLIPSTGESRAFITPLVNGVRKILRDEVPGYEEMTSAYAKTSELLKSMKQLSLGGTAQPQTILNKLVKAASTDDDFRKGLLATLKETTGKDIEAMANGLKYQKWQPAGLIGRLEEIGGFIHPQLWVAMLSSSPRIVGEFLHSVGWAGQKATTFANAVNAAGVALGVGVADKASEATQKSPQIKVRVPNTQSINVRVPNGGTQ